jgi:LL-diaminopimelate aminotransferase
MTGWRIGFAVGNAKVIAGLGKIKSNLDSGVFQAVQEASIAALKTEDSILAKLRQIFQERRDVMFAGLTSLGLKVQKPQASFYLWARVPEGYTSSSFVALLLEKAGVLGTPGVGFGAPGEGYIRFALTKDVDRIKEAVERIKAVL